MPWIMRNARSAETGQPLGTITVQQRPFPISTGNCSSEAKAICSNEPVWVAGSTIPVYLDRGSAARVQWVARAAADPKNISWQRPALHFVRAEPARLVASDGFRLHFTGPAFPVPKPTHFQVKHRKDITPSRNELPVYEGDDYPGWQVIVPPRFGMEIELDAGPLQALAKQGDRIAFAVNGLAFTMSAGFLADALFGLGKQQRVQICLNKPDFPIGIKMPDRGAVLLPFGKINIGSLDAFTPAALHQGPSEDTPRHPCTSSQNIFSIYAVCWDSAMPTSYAAIRYPHSFAQPSHLYWL